MARSIPLRGRDGSIRAHALVDDADFKWLNSWCWHYTYYGYAARDLQHNGKRIVIYMHRAILGLEYGDPRQGDHEHGDTLNNQRSNLRVVTPGQNRQNLHKLRVDNTSGERGVTWHKRNEKWMASCRLEGHQHYLGYFTDKSKAVAAVQEFRAEFMPFSKDHRELVA